MKRIHGWIAALAVLIMLAFSLTSGAQAPPGQMIDSQALQEMSSRTPRIPMRSVKPKALLTWLAAKKNVLILDVRGADRFNQNHLAGAVNLPLNALPSRYQELPLDRVVLLVDEDGTTTLLAGSYLQRKGFKDPVRLFGGMEAWRAFEAKKKK